MSRTLALAPCGKEITRMPTPDTLTNFDDSADLVFELAMSDADVHLVALVRHQAVCAVKSST